MAAFISSLPRQDKFAWSTEGSCIRSLRCGREERLKRNDLYSKSGVGIPRSDIRKGRLMIVAVTCGSVLLKDIAKVGRMLRCAEDGDEGRLDNVERGAFLSESTHD
jgi:hypothetical protein